MDVRHLHECEFTRFAFVLAVIDELEEVRTLLSGGVCGGLGWVSGGASGTKFRGFHPGCLCVFKSTGMKLNFTQHHKAGGIVQLCCTLG